MGSSSVLQTMFHLWFLIIMVSIETFYAQGNGNSEVIDLTSKNFDGFVDGSNNMLIAFIAPWCGHSQALKPSLEKLAEYFQNTPLNFDSDGSPKIAIGIVDATTEMELARRYDVSGYPTLRFFPKASEVAIKSEVSQVYNGPRDTSHMAAWLIEKLDLGSNFPSYVETPSNVLALSSVNFDAIAYDPSNTVLVMFYAPWCVHCETFRRNYEKLATLFKDEEDVVIASVNADDEKGLSNRFDISGFPTLKLYPKSEEMSHETVLIVEADSSSDSFEEGLSDFDTEVDGVRSRRKNIADKSEQELKELLSFMNKRAGTHRKLDGTLESTVGLVPVLDAFIQKRPVLLSPKSNLESKFEPFELPQNSIIELKEASLSIEKASQWGEARALIAKEAWMRTLESGAKRSHSTTEGVQVVSINIDNEGGVEFNKGKKEQTNNSHNLSDLFAYARADLAGLLSQLSDQQEDARVYLKIIDKIQSKNSSIYLEHEETRLSRMLQSNAVSGIKKSEIGKRLNVVQSLLNMKRMVTE